MCLRDEIIYTYNYIFTRLLPKLFINIYCVLINKKKQGECIFRKGRWRCVHELVVGGANYKLK